MAAPMSGAFTLLLPKCPVCGLALLQVLGLNSAFAAGLVSPVFVALAGIPAVWLALQAFQLRAWRPFTMCVLGAGLLLFGRLYWRSAYACLGGILLLSVAAIWTGIWTGRRRACRSACHTR